MSKYKTKTVKHDVCELTGKRSFGEHDVDKALGRAQTKRRRGAGYNTQRGMVMENRYYYCGGCDGFHLTHMSRKAFTSSPLAFA